MNGALAVTDNDKALVERLRGEDSFISYAQAADIIEAQAAEIERLREALRDVIECDPGAYEATIARAALGEKE